jgi:hypothetical protein
MVQNVKTMKRSKVVTIINNATFNATVTGADMNLKEFSNALITYKTGVETGAATLDIKFQVKDSVGNYIDHTVLSQITSASSGFEELVLFAGDMGRIVCTYGGTPANDYFATTTVEITLAN